jgi:hypothetical protein
MGPPNRGPSVRPTPEESNPLSAPVERAERFPFLLVGMLLVAASGLRLLGANHDLWLDEVWSVFIATRVHSLGDVFLLHHEINHPLNTLWVAWLGPGAPAAVYHAFPLACGIASVAVAAMIGWRRGRAAAWIATIPIGFSYELIAFSAEARGYAPLVLFSLLSYHFMEAYVRRPRRRLAGLYALCAVMGLLAHPAFAAFLGAATLGCLYRFCAGRNVGEALRRTIACQGVPLAVLAVLYAVDYRHVVVGGGTPIQSLGFVLLEGLAWSLGAPTGDVWVGLFGSIALFGLGWGLFNLVREQSDRWLFFAAATMGFPVFLILARNSDYVYTRHLMVGTTFLLILWGDLLAGLWSRGRSARAVCLGLLAAYVGFNGWHVADWAVNGRGQPGALVRHVVLHAGGAFETIGSDSDFRVGAIVDYYRQGLPEAKNVRYLMKNNRPPTGPDWMITHAESWTPSAAPPSEWRDARGNRYRWVRTFRTAPLSGLHLFLYRNNSVRPPIPAEQTAEAGAAGGRRMESGVSAGPPLRDSP